MTADHFLRRSPTQQNKNFVAFGVGLCYNINIKVVQMPLGVFSGFSAPISHEHYKSLLRRSICNVITTVLKFSEIF